MNVHHIIRRILRAILPTAAISCAGLATICQASHYDVVTPDNKAPIECLVQDLRHPQWTNGHYLACYSQYFSTEEKWGGYFYGGFVANPGQKKALLQFCSWQMRGKDVPAADIAFAHAGKHMSWAKSTWEGSAGGIKGHWPDTELKPNQWHRFVARTWTSPQDPGHSCVGIWLKDLGSGTWYHLATTRYPGAIKNLNNFFGFQENFTGGNADPIASVDIRNTWTLREGKWVAANKVQFRPQGEGDKRERLSLKTINDGKAVSLQTFWAYTHKATQAQKDDASFKPVNQELTYTMPAQPAIFDPMEITSLTVKSTDSQFHAQWNLAKTSCPQLGYKLEIFGTAKPKGEPLRVLSGNDPECRSLLVDIKDGASARLTLTDIYGRVDKSITRVAKPGQLKPVAKPADTVAGLNYRYFEAPAGTSWDRLPDFSKLPPARQGAVSEPDLSPRLRRTNYAFDFNGFIEVAADGIHEFSLVHASGGKLAIDGQTVIDAGAYHSIGKFSGTIALAKGKHAISLQYVQGDRQAQQADDFLQLLCAGPGSDGKPARPACTAYSRAGTSGEPAVTLKLPAGTADGKVKLSAEINGLVSAPTRVQYYLANPSFDYFLAQGARGADYFIGESTAADAPLEAMLWGGKEMTIRARLVYGDHTIDSPPVTFPSTPAKHDPWTLTELEHHQYPVAAHADGQSVALTGESMALLTQPVTGDCTLIARLAGITPAKPGPDGTAPEASQWQAGIILRNDLGASPGEPLGGNTHYVALLGAADGSIRHCDSLMKNGAGNQPSGNLGGNKRWMKLERKGNTFTEFLSEDGKTWSQVKTVELPKMGASIHAGLFIYALPSAIQLLHHASFDNVTLSSSPAKATGQ